MGDFLQSSASSKTLSFNINTQMDWIYIIPDIRITNQILKLYSKCQETMTSFKGKVREGWNVLEQQGCFHPKKHLILNTNWEFTHFHFIKKPQNLNNLTWGRGAPLQKWERQNIFRDLNLFSLFYDTEKASKIRNRMVN